MVMVDSFTGALFLVAIRDKRAPTTAAVGRLLISFIGPPAEWVTDGGGEWEGDFHAMLEDNCVVHRVTSPNHPQANGMAERGVQVAKQMLSRLLAEMRPKDDFKKLLPGVMLAYNCSKHKSTGFSPYFLLTDARFLCPSSRSWCFERRLI